MRKIKINETLFLANQVPTIQEDNAGGVTDLYYLFNTMQKSAIANGEISPIGKLSIWNNGEAVVNFFMIDGSRVQIIFTDWKFL